MKTLIYARVSIDREGRSLDEQIAECCQWADREGWEVVDVIRETGSASRYARSTGARRGWDDLTAAVSSGNIDALLTWEASRATRQLTEYAVLADLCAEHSVRWGYSGTLYDLTTRDARFRTGLDALLAQDESARTSERIQRSTRARAVTGRPHGKLPYGYRREYDPQTGALLRQVPDEEQAPIVQEIARRVIAGHSLRTIAADLTERGIAIPRPARNRTRPDAWLPVTVRRIALSPTNAGLRVHRGEVVGDAAWPALISREDHDRISELLNAPGRNRRLTADSTAVHLLSGIAVCGLCGGPMRRLNPKRARPNYTCRDCMKIARAQAPLDQHVTDVTLALLEGIDASTIDAPSPEAEAARAEADALERRLEGFTIAGAEGEVSPAALAKIEARLLPQIRAARAKAKALSTPAGIDPSAVRDPRAWWGAASLEQKRTLLRAAVRVVVHPSPATKSFRPEFVPVTPTW
ncbi:recombinase family protein [Janibacter terrae]|uniref:recombinase family protein n=1 Tax=Janibacter terrae TaxID=103817 RepID=UPI00082EA018|nr:recombinase family protein [Janibacter terrae]